RIPVPQPKISNKLVKIETTKFNFPDPGEIGNEGNSADEQLENFLRDKFIHKLPGNHQSNAANNAQNGLRQRPPVIATTSKPRTVAPVVKVQMAARKPSPQLS